MLFIALAVPIKLVVFRLLGLCGRFWRYASVDELLLIIIASGVGSLVAAAILFSLALPLGDIKGFPGSVIFIDGLLTLLVAGVPRFGVRLAEPHTVLNDTRVRGGT